MVGCQTGAMTTDETVGSLTDQGITGGTTAVFSMKQAAEVAGISMSTLRRRRSDLVAAGAVIRPDGWKVPMTALVACGLIAGEGPEIATRPASAAPRSGESHEAAASSRQIEQLTAQVRELERDVSEWRRRAEVAEARAEERGHALDALRLANETERMALRMLTAGISTSPLGQASQETALSAETTDPRHAAPVAQPQGSPHEEPRRKGFFSRVMGL